LLIPIAATRDLLLAIACGFLVFFSPVRSRPHDNPGTGCGPRRPDVDEHQCSCYLSSGYWLTSTQWSVPLGKSMVDDITKGSAAALTTYSTACRCQTRWHQHKQIGQSSRQMIGMYI